MGKAAKRKREQTAQPGSVHERIAKEAAQVRAALDLGFVNQNEVPALMQLLSRARTVINDSYPASFQHEGRTYWLRCKLVAMELRVFDSPGTSTALVTALCGSSDEVGSVLGH